MLPTSAAEKCEPLAMSQRDLAAASSLSRNWSALVSVSPHTSFPTLLVEGSGGVRTPRIIAAFLLTLAHSASRWLVPRKRLGLTNSELSRPANASATLATTTSQS